MRSISFRGRRIVLNILEARLNDNSGKVFVFLNSSFIYSCPREVLQEIIALNSPGSRLARVEPALDVFLMIIAALYTNIFVARIYTFYIKQTI